jgi:sulfur carrier protein ThiS
MFHTNERIDKMKIEANLYATLARYMPNQNEKGNCVVDIADGATVKDVLQQLNIPIDLVKLIFVDGIHASRESNLKDGSRLGVFPPVGGG